MKYRVHIYTVVRVPVDVEAESQKAAMEKATEETQFNDVLDHEGVEFADEIVGYMVDEEGDEEYQRTTTYNGDMEEAPL